MSIRKIVGMDNGIEDFRIEVTPRTITLPRICKAFVLYLQKGMQIIGKFQSTEGTVLKQPFYRFRHLQPAIFRINNLSHCGYSWSLYSINLETNEQTFEDSATFNIERTIKLYQVQLLEKEREIQTSFREKNVTKGMVLELWGKVRREMKSCRSVQKCVFSNQDYQIEFQLEIKNTLDLEVERAEDEQQINSLRRVRSEQMRSSHSENKSRLVPNVIQLESSPYRSQSNIKENDAINTKQTIQAPIEQTHPQPTTSPDDLDTFNATVKIVNPCGQQIDANRQDLPFTAGVYDKNYGEDSSQYNLNNNYPTTTKKFSLLSDIIQMSHQGSSSYHPDRSSSNGNRLALRKDNTIDLVIETRRDESPEPLNKFKTLPYESHHKLEVRDQFRRAQTAEKLSEAGSSQIQEEHSYISNGQGQAIEEEEGKVKRLMKQISLKWAIVVVLLLVLSISAAVYAGDSSKKKSKRRQRAQ